MKIFDVIIFVIILIMLGLAGGYAARASSLMKQNLQFGRDPRVASARSLMRWASIMCFIAILVTIVVLVLFFVFGDTTSQGTRKAIILGLGIFLFVWVLIAGILAAVGASRFRKSLGYSGTGTDVTAYNSAITTAVLLLLGMTILFVIWLLVFLLRKPKRIDEIKEKVTETAKEIKETVAGKAKESTDAAKDAAKSVQRKADEILETAQRKAKEILESSEQKAAKITADAQAKALAAMSAVGTRFTEAEDELRNIPIVGGNRPKVDLTKSPNPIQRNPAMGPIRVNVPATPPVRVPTTGH